MAALRILAFALVALMLPPCVEAEPRLPIDLSVNANGAALLHGDWNGNLVLSSLQHSSSDFPRPGNSKLQLQVRNARIVLLHDEVIQVPNQDVRNLDPLVDEDFHFTGTITVLVREGRSYVSLLPPESNGVLTGALHGAVAWRFNHPASAPTGDGFHVDFENRRYTATYGSAPRVEAPVEGLQIHDDFVGLAYTADVILQDASGTRTVTTGDTVEYSTTPLPGKTIEKKTSRYLVFQAQAGDAAAFGDWTFDVQSLAGALQGGLAINGVSDLHGSPTLPVDKASLVQLDGDLYLQGAYPGGGNNDDVRSTWTLQGQATMLGIDAHALDLASFNPGLAVAGGAGLLVLLGLLFKSQLAALLAGYTKAEPLGNDARRQMLALIQARPGITIPELGAQLGVQRATVRFHAQVLVRAKLVQQHGRPFHYSPVDADAQASAALSQDVRRRIHAILLGNHAPLARSRIQDLLAAEGKPVSKVLLNWHLRALLDARIVIRQGVNRASTYLLAPIQRAAPSVQAPSPLSVP